MASSGGITGAPLSDSAIVFDNQDWPIYPLESWRNRIGYHPWHFYGVKDSNLIKVTSACNTVVPLHAWQRQDSLSRMDILTGIADAEARLREYLYFSVGRRFVTETVQHPRPKLAGQQYGRGVGGDGRWINVRLREGFIRNVGVETFAALDEAATVTLSDADGDSLNDTFTLTVAGVSSTLDTDEVAVYFVAADRLNSDPVGERYRVKPLSIKLSGSVLTIKGPAWLLVRPVKQEGFAAGSGYDYSEENLLASTVAVYRRYCNAAGTTDATAQALLVWETAPYPAFACVSDGPTYTDSSTDPSAIATAQARLNIRDARLGEVTVGRAAYSATTGVWTAVNWNTCRQPDRIIIRYEAGARLRELEDTDNQTMDHGRWGNIVTRLACAEMKRRPLGCEDASQNLWRWQFDLARSAGVNDEQYRIDDKALGNPFGTAAGAVYAWNQVKNLKITRALAL